MEIKRFVSPMLQHNMYIISDDCHAVIIDPYYGEGVDELLNDLSIDFMLVTHEHYDHISGVNCFKEKYGCKLLANEKCNKNLQNPSKNFAKFFEAYCEFQKNVEMKNIPFDDKYACLADNIFGDNHTIEWRGHRFFIKVTPGHSEGSNFIFLDDGVLFSGDTLLPEDIPAARFPGGNKKGFNNITLPYLRSLPGNLMVYPGHEDGFKLDTYYLYNVVEKG